MSLCISLLSHKAVSDCSVTYIAIYTEQQLGHMDLHV